MNIIIFLNILLQLLNFILNNKKMFLNSFQQLLLLFIILSNILVNSFKFDITQNSVHGTEVRDLTCNKDTVIDFNFSPDTKLKDCGSGCTTVTINFIIFSHL